MTAKHAVFEYNTLNQRTKLTRYQSIGTSNLVGSTEYAYDTVNRLQGILGDTHVLQGYLLNWMGVYRIVGFDDPAG